MYARSTTFTADLVRLDEGIAHVRDQVAPMLADIDGCIGVSLLADRTSGRCIATSAWRDEESLRASDAQVGPLRERAAEVFQSMPGVQVWQIAVLHRVREAGDGACVRVTWTRIDPDRLERSVENYRTNLLPAMEDLPGFRSASLFVDPPSGRAVSSVTYDSRASLEASREMAVSLRRSAVEENDLQILQVVEFDLVLAHLRVPELV